MTDTPRAGVAGEHDPVITRDIAARPAALAATH